MELVLTNEGSYEPAHQLFGHKMGTYIRLNFNCTMLGIQHYLVNDSCRCSFKSATCIFEKNAFVSHAKLGHTLDKPLL